MKDKQGCILIFFAIDNDYIPFFGVALRSLIDNSNDKNYYIIKVLHTNVTKENSDKILKYENENIKIEFVDLSDYIKNVKDKLYTRDYYTNTTYFRLFIPDLYPKYDKVLYLDSDIIVLDDVAKLYNIDIEDNLVAAVPDDIIQNNKLFQNYVEKVVGVAKYQNYFNAGVLLMNLEELRKFNFQEKFLYLLTTIKFSFAQDQDYLNRLCKGRVKYIDLSWDVMPYVNRTIKKNDIKLIHYNFAYKPWLFEDVLYKEFFWEYAKKTEFFDKIIETQKSYTEEQKIRDKNAEKALIELAKKESDCVGDDRSSYYVISEKQKERLEIIEKIKRLELEGKFDIDVEKDPPSNILYSNKIDYLRESRYSRIKTKLANMIGEKFLNDILKDNKLIIKDINGIENLQSVKTGAMITCNHFNPYDSFSIEQVFRIANINKKLYKVIREGNYTNFPGLYGFFFRNCNTLPLSSSKTTMIKFIKAVDIILQRGDFILIYPEQSLWWNYRKPKPLKNGAFKLASRNYVPIIPIFITMEDSKIIGDDGFPVQEYTINISKPIYPDDNLKVWQNSEIMKKKNFDVWRKIYEDFYKKPLKYTTKKSV